MSPSEDFSATEAAIARKNALTIPPWAVAGCGLALACLLLLTLRNLYNDDAYIALRYARNLIAGNGVVWNPGERVEGYTSLLWVLGSAFLGSLGFELQVASRALGVATLLLLLLILPVRRGTAGALTTLLLASMGPVVGWAVGGLETVAFALLITMAMLASERLLEDLRKGPALVAHMPVARLRRRMFLVGVLFGLAELCRPEATLFALIVLLFIVLGWIKHRAPRTTAGVLATGLAGFSLLSVSRLIWRIAYYHDVVPNTFRIKAGAGFGSVPGGLAYLGDFLLYYPVVALLALAGWDAWRKTRLTHSEKCLLSAVAAYLLYVVWIGGDHMQWFRFVVPVVPLCTLICMRRIAPQGPDRRRELLSLLLVLVFCFMNVTSTVYLAKSRSWAQAETPARNGKTVGIYIRDHWPRGALVALNTAGSTPYYSGMPCIDMLGLNDRHIARREMPPADPRLPWTRLQGHHKGDGAYVLSRSPQFIILGGSEGFSQPWFYGDAEICRDPRFTQLYRLRTVSIPRQDGATALLFRYYERLLP